MAKTKKNFEDGYNQALKDYEKCKDIEKIIKGEIK